MEMGAFVHVRKCKCRNRLMHIKALHMSIGHTNLSLGEEVEVERIEMESLGWRPESRVQRKVRESRTTCEESSGNGFIPLKFLELNSQNWTPDLKLYKYIFSLLFTAY